LATKTLAGVTTMSWTVKKADKLQYDGRSFCFFPDPSAKDGSGIRVLPSGKKSFVFRFNFQGRKKYMTYGTYRGDSASIAQAYKAQRKLLVDLDNGIDPSAQRDTKKWTIAEYFEKYLEGRMKLGRSANTIRSYGNSWNLIEPFFGNRLMLDIKRQDIQGFYDSLLPQHARATQCIRLFKAMFYLAEVDGGVPESTPNPCRGVRTKPMVARTRYLDDEELGRLYKVLNALPEKHKRYRDIISLLIQNGLRKDELLKLKWENVKLDGDNPHVYLLRTKNKKDHMVPLVDGAIKIFKGITKVEGNPYVFPSTHPKCKEKPLADIAGMWGNIRKKAGITDVRIHDLRRTCGSILAQAGVPLEVIQTILNHSNPEMTKIYARLAPKQTKDALTITGEKIDNLLNQDKIRLVG